MEAGTNFSKFSIVFWHWAVYQHELSSCASVALHDEKKSPPGSLHFAAVSIMRERSGTPSTMLRSRHQQSQRWASTHTIADTFMKPTPRHICEMQCACVFGMSPKTAQATLPSL